tara:strand:- start:1342 stop:1917 length:576 start_codon:yes stop_codon:yes gene_type:complete
LKTILILGNDKLGGRAYERLPHNDHLKVLIDRSTNLKRVLRLLLKRILPFSLFLKMIVAEYFRAGSKPAKSLSGISENSELLRIMNEFKPNRVLLYRAGLIVNKSVLDAGLKILNVHAAKVPEYGGIGSLHKALLDKALEQYASLHEVTVKIDQGQLVDTEKFTLDANLSYSENERIAYDASLRLLLRNIR